MICDIRLPDIDGEEVFRRAASTADAPPFLFITAHADIDQAVRLMRAGAGDFVTKPFAMDDFLTRIAAVIAVARSPSTNRRSASRNRCARSRTCCAEPPTRHCRS